MCTRWIPFSASSTTICEWPEELYDERKVVTLGIMVPLENPMKPGFSTESSQIDHVDLTLDPVAVNRLLEEAKLRPFGELPAVHLESR